MATFTPSVLTPTTQLTGAAQALYTAGPGQTIVRKANFANTTTSPVTVVVYRVPNGGAPATANILVPAYTVPAGSSWIVNELNGLTLGAGDAVWALASTGLAINATMSGAIYTP